MVDEVQRFSDFMGDLNKPHNIPMGVRHYCIADALVPTPCAYIGLPPTIMTDGFLELDSTLAVSPSDKLPCPTINLEEYKPKGYLPKYKGKLISGFDNWHIKLTSNAGEILKAIDDTKPVIEVTEVKDTQNKVIWRVGQWPDYFVVPTDGRVKVYGLCRKEYLPADTSINIGFRKAGQTDVNWITESGGTTPDQAQARQWLLQPSDLWIASDPNSPVAEFEVEINFPREEITHSIVVQATNPAGIKSDPVEVSEKTHYIYAVGRDEDGGVKFLCLDGPTSFADGVSAVVSEFNLVDEEGDKMSARPLDVTTDGGSTIWVSFDNRKIYCYDITTMEPKQLNNNLYYYTTTSIPDGITYPLRMGDELGYCSATTNKVYGIDLSNHTEGEFGTVKKLSSPYAIVEYLFNPTAISTDFLCSATLNKISSYGLSGYPYYSFVVVTGIPNFNEQDTPAPVLGIYVVPDYSVPVDPGASYGSQKAIYLSCTDGDIYKVKFVTKTVSNPGSLTILDQFTMADGVAEGITTGPRVKIRIEPEFLLLNVGISREFKVNGKGPYIWESGDETVAEIEGIIPQINGVGEVVSIKAVGIGVATITARDALGNIAYANVDVRE